MTLYRTEEYSCTRNIQVPYEVVIDEAKSKVNVQIEGEVNNPKVEFTAIMNDKGKVVLTAKNVDEDNILILAKLKIEDQELVEGEEVEDKAMNTWNYNILLEDIDKILAPVTQKIDDVSLRRKAMTFKVGKISNPEYFSYFVSLERKGKVALEKEFASHEVNIIEGEDFDTVSIVLKENGIKIKKRKKYNVKIAVKAKFPGIILNQREIKTTMEFSDRIKAKK